MRLVSPGFGYVVAQQTSHSGPYTSNIRLLVFSGGRWRDATPPAFRPPAFPQNEIDTVDDIAFVGRQDGWVAAYDCARAAVDLYRTTDGGRSWRSLGRPASHSCSAPATTFLSFVDATHGWMEPVSPTGPAGDLYRTSDGGRSWGHVASGPVGGPGWQMPCLAPVRFVSLSTGWMGRCDESGSGAFVTRDGGRHWKRAALGVRDGRFDVPWFNGREGVEAVTVGTRAVSENGHTRAVVFSVTHDGGRVWTTRSIRPIASCALSAYNTDLWPTGIVNSHVWWVVSGGDKQTVQITTNGGRNWTTTVAHGLPSRPCSVVDVSAAGAKTAWLVARVDTYDSALYRTVDGGRHWRSVTIFKN